MHSSISGILILMTDASVTGSWEYYIWSDPQVSSCVSAKTSIPVKSASSTQEQGRKRLILNFRDSGQQQEWITRNQTATLNICLHVSLNTATWKATTKNPNQTWLVFLRSVSVSVMATLALYKIITITFFVTTISYEKPFLLTPTFLWHCPCTISLVQGGCLRMDVALNHHHQLYGNPKNVLMRTSK